MRKLITLCAISCAMWLPLAHADGIPLSGRFAGTVINGFQLDSSGNPADFLVSEAAFTGALGIKRLSVLSQFVPDFSLTVCQPGEIPLAMVYARSVTTAQDLSVYYADYDSGWICQTPGPAGTSSYYGHVAAHIVGGTGRFNGASGYFESDFYGNNLTGSLVINCPTSRRTFHFLGTRLSSAR